MQVGDNKRALLNPSHRNPHSEYHVVTKHELGTRGFLFLEDSVLDKFFVSFPCKGRSMKFL